MNPCVPKMWRPRSRPVRVSWNKWSECMADQIIRGGTLVTPEGLLRADVAIENGTIAAIGPELPGARVEIDARGLHVFPAMIDVHLHFNEPGRTEWEGAATGSRALAPGGGAG